MVTVATTATDDFSPCNVRIPPITDQVECHPWYISLLIRKRDEYAETETTSIIHYCSFFSLWNLFILYRCELLMYPVLQCFCFRWWKMHVKLIFVSSAYKNPIWCSINLHTYSKIRVVVFPLFRWSYPSKWDDKNTKRIFHLI